MVKYPDLPRDQSQFQMLIAVRGRDIVHLKLILNLIELILKVISQSARYKKIQFLP